MDKKLYTIEESADFLSLTPQYVRALIRTGKLTSTLVPITENSAVKKHVVEKGTLIAFRDGSSRRSRRNDGRYKYLLYLHDNEVDGVIQALEDAGFVEASKTLQSANPRKM